MVEVLLGSAVFTSLVLVLAGVIMLARRRLVPRGMETILVNGERTIQGPLGETLLSALAGGGLLLPSACGGQGTCGLCRVRVVEGGGKILPTERALISRRDATRGVRLACQLKLRGPLDVEVPASVFGARHWRCSVRSNRQVATFIREIVLALPPGETIAFRAGGYVQVACPPYRRSFRDLAVEEPFRTDWDRFGVWDHEVETEEPQARAYSMANYPLEDDIIMLNVRLALPPPGAPPGTPAGIVSSYLFGLEPGAAVEVSGPFGEFFARETDREMVFIGGGAGMAPMRSHILDQLERLRTARRVSYWYGARSLKELFYADLFERLADQHPNFAFHVALSEPMASDHWQGSVGFIHDVVFDEYLSLHPAPEECEYYVCGPPMMSAAVTRMLENLGVDRENVLMDDFGGAV